MQEFVDWSQLNQSEILTHTHTFTVVLEPAHEDAAVHRLSHGQTLEMILQTKSPKVP